jgi:transposase
MLTYERLSAKPSAFKSMTGLSVEEFQSLLRRVTPRYEAFLTLQRARADRRRAPGGGVRSRHDLTERLLMTMVWLRLYVTCEAVGFMFDVDKGTVSRFTRPILSILRDLGEDTLGWPQEARELAEKQTDDTTTNPPLPPMQDQEGSASAEDPGQQEQSVEPSDTAQVMTPDRSHCSDYLAIIDATEQQTERAKNYAVQKLYYSGKRKTHTIKTQIVVSQSGRICHLTDSVPGSTHDLTLLRQSGLKDELPEGLTVTADTGYRGLQNDFPDRSVALPYRPKDKQQLIPEEKLHNHFISRIRVVVENTLAELKHFQTLAVRFRHSLQRHSEITRAIAGIINWRIDKRLTEQSS